MFRRVGIARDSIHIVQHLCKSQIYWYVQEKNVNVLKTLLV